MMSGSILYTMKIIKKLCLQLEAYLRYTQVELEYLLWDQMELEGRLQKAIKERRVMEMLLSELEEEHEKTVSRLELLEDEVVCLSFYISHFMNTT